MKKLYHILLCVFFVLSWYNAYGSFTYKYHLGSTRVAFTPPPSGAGGPVVLQENSYYPFGAPIKDFTWNATTTNRNPYLREGKEYLATHNWNKYDFTGRTFDPWTAQALQVDPMAEKYYSTSPYALWGNNPLKFVDPTGNFLGNPENTSRSWWDQASDFLSTYFGFGLTSSAETDEQAAMQAENRAKLDDIAQTMATNKAVAQEVLDYVPLLGSAFNMSEAILEDDFASLGINTVSFTFDAVGAGLIKGGAKIGAKAGINKLPIQIHHFATNKSRRYTSRMEAIAKEFDLDLNGAWNKMPIPHNGRHTNKYHDFVLQGMQNAKAGAGGNQEEFLRLFDEYVKQPVMQNPAMLYMK